jgi:hypothetical protein
MDDVPICGQTQEQHKSGQAAVLQDATITIITEAGETPEIRQGCDQTQSGCTVVFSNMRTPTTIGDIDQLLGMGKSIAHVLQYCS